MAYKRYSSPFKQKIDEVGRRSLLADAEYDPESGARPVHKALASDSEPASLGYLGLRRRRSRVAASRRSSLLAGFGDTGKGRGSILG